MNSIHSACLVVFTVSLIYTFWHLLVFRTLTLLHHYILPSFNFSFTRLTFGSKTNLVSKLYITCWLTQYVSIFKRKKSFDNFFSSASLFQMSIVLFMKKNFLTFKRLVCFFNFKEWHLVVVLRCNSNMSSVTFLSYTSLSWS